MLRHTLVLSALVAASLTVNAHGQGLTQGLRDLELSGEDYDLMKGAAKALYTAETPVIGDEGLWQNPETRSHGTVELVAFDGQCASVAHLFRVGPTKSVHKLTSRRCKSADGEWQIAPLE